jgi:hypothetical protein
MKNAGVLTFLVVAASWVVPGAALAIPSDTQLFADDFESGTLANWTADTRGNGSIAVQPGVGVGDSKGARITVPDYLSDSMAYVRHTLAEPVYAISAAGSFKIVSAGCDENAGYSGGSVPLLRFFDTSGKRIVGLQRINGSCSKTAKLYVQHSGNYYRTGKNLGLGQFYKAELRITVSSPNQSLVQVYVNDNLVYSVTTADNGLEPIASVTMHNEHPDQVGDLVADDVRLGTFASTPPVNPCNGATPAPATGDPGTTILADNFESYTFDQWTIATREGDAAASIATNPVHSGNCAARVRVTAQQGSKANLSKSTPAGTRGIWADGWFNVLSAGSNTNSNVPLFRMFSGGQRIFDVYRANGSGQLYTRLPNGSGGFTFTSLGRILALNRWYRLKVHADVSGAAEFWLDGVLLRSIAGVPYGASSIQSVMSGAEHFAQEGEFAVDDIVIKAVP